MDFKGNKLTEAQRKEATEFMIEEEFPKESLRVSRKVITLFCGNFLGLIALNLFIKYQAPFGLFFIIFRYVTTVGKKQNIKFGTVNPCLIYKELGPCIALVLFWSHPYHFKRSLTK